MNNTWGEDMYGVVLWADQRQNRAVIWCEDHGDLAYYRGAVGGDAALAPGDLVEFNLRNVGHMRLADEPRLITRRSHPTLSSDLRQAGARLGVLESTDKRGADADDAGKVVLLNDARHCAYA